MLNKIIIVSIISFCSGILYRLGGKEGFNTRFRDIGCGLVNILTCVLIGLTGGLFASILAYFFMFGMSWAGYASYWGLDEQKWGFWAHGLGISLAALPVALLTGHWLSFGLRVIVNTALITIWSQWTSQVDIEEGGRGIIANITLPLLLIG